MLERGFVRCQVKRNAEIGDSRRTTPYFEASSCHSSTRLLLLLRLVRRSREKRGSMLEFRHCSRQPSISTGSSSAFDAKLSAGLFAQHRHRELTDLGEIFHPLRSRQYPSDPAADATRFLSELCCIYMAGQGRREKRFGVTSRKRQASIFVARFSPSSLFVSSLQNGAQQGISSTRQLALHMRLA